MADTNGIRSPNVPLAALTEVLGHADAGGGAKMLARSSIGALAEAVRDAVAVDPSGVAGVRSDLAALTNVVGGKATLADVVRMSRAGSSLFSHLRPGDNPAAFTAQAVLGDPAALLPLDTALYPVRTVGDGLGVEISGSREVWTRPIYASERGRLLRVRWRVTRTTDPKDPNGDALTYLVAWYSPDRVLTAVIPFTANSPTVAEGARETAAFLGDAGATGVTIPRSDAAPYFRIGIRAFGNEGRTVLTDMGVEDVSDARSAVLALVPPDSIPALTARIDGETARAIAAEKSETASRILGDIPAIRADGLRQQKRSVPRVIKQILPEGITPRAYGPSNFLEWTVGIGLPRDVANPDTVTFWLQFLDLTDTLTIKFYARPGANPFGSDGSAFIWPGSFVQDVLLTQGTYSVAELATLSPGTLSTPIHLPIRAAGALNATTWYYPTISAKNKAGQPIGVAVGRGRDRQADNIEPVYLGGLLRDANGNVLSPQDRGMVAYALSERRFIEGYRTGSDARQIIDRAAAPKLIQNERTTDNQSFYARLPEMQTGNVPDPIIISDATGTTFAGITAPPISTVTGEATTLVYNYDQPLKHRHVDNVVARGGGATLAEGTNYKLNRPLGLIQGLQSVGDQAITVDYTWAPDRYDTIVASPANGGILVAQGTNRDYAPNEFIPDNTGFIPLFRVYVTRNAIEMIPVHEFDGFVRRGEEGRYATWIGRNKACLPKTFALLKAGQPIRLGGYGDSITAMTGGGADPYTPNGNRDQVGFLTGSGYPQTGFPIDVVNMFPRFLSNPFGAQDPNGAYIRVGWLWALKDLFERRYGSLTEVRNWGVPGTSSGYDNGGSGPNAGYPDRINAYMADKCDLTIFAFGMNERGYYASRDNIVPQIKAIQASGSEVMVITCPRPNRARGSEPDDWWLSTTRQYVQAAIECGCAYVDLSEISGPGNEGGMGISGSTMCGQNEGNHPAYFEYLKGYNPFICETFAR